MVSSKLTEMMTNKFSVFFIALTAALIIFNGCEELGIIDDSKDTNQSLFPVKVNNQYGFINEEGRMLIEPVYQSAYAFSDGLAAVRRSNRWYYIDSEAEIVIDGKGTFQELRPFKDGLAPIRIQGRWGFINTRGEITINPRFRSVTAFSENRSFVRSLDFRSWFYIDKQGMELTADLAANGMDNHENTQFSNGRALVKDNNLFGYLNENIETVIPISYAEAKVFSNNLAAVKISDRWGYITTDGSVAINPQFIAADVFSEDLAAVRLASNSFGYINTKGEMVISEQFEEASPFNEGRAIVQQSGLYGIIDKEGNWIIQPTYEQIDSFENGLAKIYQTIIKQDQNTELWYGYINRMGKVVWVPSN